MSDKRVIRPEDRNLFLAPGDPQVSPDGSRVAFTLQRTDPENDKLLSDVYVVDIQGGNPKRLTSSGTGRLPRWSPDGSTLAFVSDRHERPEIWLLDMSGGEAFALTTKATVSGAPVWSPDGKQIAFTSRVFSKAPGWVPYGGSPEGDRTRAEYWAREKRDRTDKKWSAPEIKVITRLRHKLDGVGFFGDRRSHVFVIGVPPLPLQSDQEAIMRQITTGDHDHDWPCWSPCGRHIAFSARRTEDADSDNVIDIWSADTESGQLRMLLSAKGASAAPVWSPDGKYIAYVGHDASHEGSTTPEVRVFAIADCPVTEESVVSLSKALDRPANSAPSSDVRLSLAVVPPVWVDDTVYFFAGDKGDTFVYKCVPNMRPERVAGSAAHEVSAVTAAPGVIVFQCGSATQPDDIYCKTAKGVRRLTAFNDALLAELLVCPVEPFTYKAPDGWEMGGWYILPAGYVPGKRYPVALQIHGGPHGAFGSSFQFQGQMLASNGYLVLYTNPRGSQGYGQEFAAAVVKDWGGRDFHDIMAGVDHVIEAGLADPEKMGVMGWSYGGFMTCWTVTQTDRFKAAIAGACIANRHSFYGTSDIGYYFGHNHFGGTPWDDSGTLLARSAIQDVKKVRTPVLLLHGEADLRCPVEQSEQFFLALKKLGRPAVLVRYPDEYHIFKRPSYWQDRMARILAWMNHHVMN